MPRYYFDNGTDDLTGMELATEEQARQLSFKVAQNLMSERVIKADDITDYVVTVRDDEGALMETKLTVSHKRLRL